MKRFLGFSVAMFCALVAIALVGGDAGAVAGHGCHGARKCHGGGLLSKIKLPKRCHGGAGLLSKLHGKKRCHGAAAAAPAACESGCGEAVPAAVIRVPVAAARSLPAAATAAPAVARSSAAGSSRAAARAVPAAARR